MKFSHVNIVARDANKLADFYNAVFGCKDNTPRETVSGEGTMRAMGLSNNQFYGAWLSLPGVEGAYIEIFQFKESKDGAPSAANRIGLAHLSFDVDDLTEVCEDVVANGGSVHGEIATFEENGQALFSFVYMRDPEGNLLDLKQRF